MTTNTLICLMGVFVVAGCFVFTPHITYQGCQIILLHDNPTLYSINPDRSVGDAVGHLRGNAGDTVSAIGFSESVASPFPNWIIQWKGANVVIDSCEALDKYVYDNFCTSPMRVKKQDDRQYWAFANRYLGEVCGLEIQGANENLIATSIPLDTTLCGFTISRTPSGRDYLYEVKSTSRGVTTNCEASQRDCLFFVRTGRRYEPFWK